MDAEYMLVISPACQARYQYWYGLLTPDTRMLAQLMCSAPAGVDAFADFVSRFELAAARLWLLDPKVARLALALVHHCRLPVPAAIGAACDLTS